MTESTREAACKRGPISFVWRVLMWPFALLAGSLGVQLAPEPLVSMRPARKSLQRGRSLHFGLDVKKGADWAFVDAALTDSELVLSRLTGVYQDRSETVCKVGVDTQISNRERPRTPFGYVYFTIQSADGQLVEIRSGPRMFELFSTTLSWRLSSV